MSAVGVLSAVGAFLAALALLHATGRWRPEQRSLRPRNVLATWRTPPASRFLISWVLGVVAMIAMSATATTVVWAVPLLCAGVVVAHAGVKIVRNVDGWADTLARLSRTAQGIDVPNPQRSVRVQGAAWVLIGALFVFFAVANVIVDM